MGEQADHREVLKVLVVSNYVDHSFRTFEIMPPSSKHLEYGEEFLVVCVIIEFRNAQGVRMESNGVDFTIGGNCREDRSDGIVGGVSFDYEWHSRDEVQEDQSRRECRFQGVKSELTIIRPMPQDVLLSEAVQWSDGVRVSMDEMVVEIGKA